MQSQRKVNVMHVILDLAPGGAERVVLNYIKFHDRDRFIPIVCVLRHLAAAERWELIQGKNKFFFMDKGNGFKPKMILRLSDVLKNQRIDVLHLHNFSAILYGTIAGLLANTKVIIQTEHNVVTTAFNLQRKLKGYLKLPLGLASQKIIAVSDQVKESQKRHNFFARNKFVTIHNGIDISEFEYISRPDSLKAELNIDRNKIVLTNIASLTLQKGHEILIEAAGKIIEKNRDVVFLIVGDGPRKNQLTDLVNQKGLSNYFIFTGIRNDVPKLLKITDIFVLASHWEGLPITVLEAMASKVPVVVTNVGGNREAVINDYSGILVEPNNPHALSKAIASLIKSKELRKKMGANGKRRIDAEFCAEKMVRKTEKLYEEALVAKNDY
jgi:glycosyltransferase involved in cell wall biosynthesis